MQDMDSTITKAQKRNLTDMQEKFLDVLFAEARGNPREAQASIRLAAANSILDRVGIVKKDQLDINMKALHGIFILPAKDGTDKNKKKS